MRVLQFRKLLYSLTHASCWRALSLGVVPGIEHLPVLRQLAIDGIIDIGANRGQFAFAARQAHPSLPILAFEPIPHEAHIFRQVHGQFAGIRLIESALGESTGSALMHLSRSADSSSLLPIGRLHTELYKNTEEIGTITVPMRRLDDFAEHWTGRARLLLKLDVQGFELSALRGAEVTLRSCAHVYAECSEVALYDGQALRVEVEEFLQHRGFSCIGHYNDHVVEGKLVQADYLFSR